MEKKKKEEERRCRGGRRNNEIQWNTEVACFLLYHTNMVASVFLLW